ncbi:DUF5687 family protein [Sphingobacterium psychroaquaticum]|uniref:Uncharacterized protein n=1 Tax=Sphingobacterium psychroaquaticum TaxID=561061 RepID=A0A1X7I2W1_9SPHI|nr:DUF5687 family protein [Sphingobacterium psychroaquaticum]QBQ42021.1 hypothetical protein E2P86_13025 [Sphingobacterium psychroaquaticum]SMG08029.1 hypothetical protein SAMN05660862_0339 [Sphingobacterium psychroaquaticum]
MFRRLFVLEWKAFFRSASLGKGIAMKALLGFFALYFMMIFLSLGLGIHPLLEKYFPGQDPLHIINSYLLVWFAVDLFIRFMMQNLPVMRVKPLLLQEIKRKIIVNYVLIKTLFSFFNLLAFLFFIPFVIVYYTKNQPDLLAILAWLVAVKGVVFSINFLNFIIQRTINSSITSFALVVSLVGGLYLLDHYAIFSLTSLFGTYLDTVLKYPILALIPAVLCVLLYIINVRQLSNLLYLDASLKGKSETVQQLDLDWTNRFGKLAPFLQLDIRLMWRNKRTKATLYMALLFLGYGLIFYPSSKPEGSVMLIFVGIFITGIFVANFGQFVPAWDSSYFPMLMTQNIPFYQYLQSKALLMTLSVVILAILSTPYVYFGYQILFLQLACALYNIGVNIPLILYFGSFNRKRIDLDKSATFNYQGTGAAQWLIIIPFMLGPMLIWGLTSMIWNQQAAVVALALFGVMGLLLRKMLIQRIAACYDEKKHDMLIGFKQSVN